MANKPIPAEKLPKIVRATQQERQNLRNDIWGSVKIEKKEPKSSE